ncbi:sensor histidine kinase [Bifidobacterium moraviense]|nr:hypothetical protein [Bifidobacterium sp. DSM 109958]
MTDEEAEEVMPQSGKTPRTSLAQVRQWCGVHRMTYWIMAAIAASWSVLEWVWEPTVGVFGGLVAAIHVAGIMMIPIFPRMASAFTILFAAAACLVPSSGGPSQIWGLFLAFGVLGYTAASWMAVGCYATLMLASVIQLYVLQPAAVTDPRTLLSFATAQAIAACFGRALQWRQRMEAAQRERALLSERQREIKRNTALALALHDQVSGSLSLASREAQRRMRRIPPDSDEYETLQRINADVLDGLNGLHDAIDQLRHVDAAAGAVPRRHAPEPDADLRHALRRLIEQEDRRLAKLGYHGQGSVEFMGSDDLSPQLQQELLGLTAELYANICRHCPASGTYALSIRRAENVIVVTERNDRFGDDSGTDGSVIGGEGSGEELRGGHGLALHARAVAALGGTCEFRPDHHAWSVTVRIPLRA